MRSVVVAHDSEPIRAVITALLEAAGFGVRGVADGYACLDAVDQAPPSALVLDVALAGPLAFQVIETVRTRAPGTKIMLVASIYNRTSYKRRPTSLYGADDYVEQHHIADALVDKLHALLGGTPMAVGAGPVIESAEARAVRRAGEERFDDAAGHDAVTPAALQRAERLARLIVSDIALYNGDAIAAARDRDGLEAHLRADLEEGRLLFELRVPRAVRATRDFVGEALAELLAGRKPQAAG